MEYLMWTLILIGGIAIGYLIGKNTQKPFRRKRKKSPPKLRVVKLTQELLTWYEIESNRSGRWARFVGHKYPNRESAESKMEEIKEELKKPKKEVINETLVDSFGRDYENEFFGDIPTTEI